MKKGAKKKASVHILITATSGLMKINSGTPDLPHFLEPVLIPA